MSNITTLNKLITGQKCKITNLNADGLIRRRFLDLGLIPGTNIEVLQESPSGNLFAYLIRGTIIAIRSEDSSLISVEIL